MKFVCPLIAISNLKISKQFYEEVLGQKIILDLGWNMMFSGGFTFSVAKTAKIIQHPVEFVKSVM